MNEQTIHSIIDDIASAAKLIVSEHLEKEEAEIVAAFRQSAEDWERVTDDVKATFEGLDKSLLDYFRNLDRSFVEPFGSGDEIYHLNGGCAVKDKIKDVMVLTESGKWLRVDKIFRSMDGLVEHLKKNVRG